MGPVEIITSVQRRRRWTPRHCQIKYRADYRFHLVSDAFSWPWSSAQAHLQGKDDWLVKVDPLLAMAGDWRHFLAEPEDEHLREIRKHEGTGRPLGPTAFVEKLESTLGRFLKRGKPGPKMKVS